MRIKKALMICITMTLLFTLMSCNNVEMDNNSIYPPTNNNEGEKLHSTNESSTQELHGGPPTTISFSSMEQIQQFVQAMTGTAEQYEIYMQQYDHDVSDSVEQEEMKEAAEIISGHLYPFVKEGVIIEGFNATYTIDRAELDIIVITANTHVCFSYKYELTETFKYDSEPILEELPIHNTTMNLYFAGYYPVGSVLLDTVPILLVVHNGDVSFNMLNDFEFQQIGS